MKCHIYCSVYVFLNHFTCVKLPCFLLGSYHLLYVSLTKFLRLVPQSHFPHKLCGSSCVILYNAMILGKIFLGNIIAELAICCLEVLTLKSEQQLVISGKEQDYNIELILKEGEKRGRMEESREMKSKPFYFYTWPIQAWVCKTLVTLPWPFPVCTRKLILDHRVHYQCVSEVHEPPEIICKILYLYCGKRKTLNFIQFSKDMSGSCCFYFPGLRDFCEGQYGIYFSIYHCA